MREEHVDNIKKYYRILTSCPLFAGMDRHTAEQAVSLLGGTVTSHIKGELLHKPWSPLTRFGLVLSGSVQACCDDLDGNRMIMADVQPGVTFGESLCFMKIPDSPVYIHASEDCEILWLSLDRLYGGEPSAAAAGIQERFTALLASRALVMNSRIQILSKKSIREKLAVYFSQLSSAYGKDEFTVPLNREDMATYIGTDRSALSRELSRMKKEGIIDYRKNLFRITGHLEK